MSFRKTITTYLLILLVMILPVSRAEIFDISESFQGGPFAPPPNYSTHWVDSVFNTLTTEQMIAQLLMIEVHSNQNSRYYRQVERLIDNYNIGGIVFFNGGPASQLNLTNKWQRQAQTPMLISQDAEWGLSMRLDSTISFPRQITLGAIANERLLYELGMEMGAQCKRMGIHINFSPVMDVNSNADNPVINSRSFGECRYNVARKGMALMFGMQDAGIIATAKHFPGHGDTRDDSHYTLPVIHQPAHLYDSLHIFPFRQLVNQGLLGVMSAHLNIPHLDNTDKIPSSLSDKIVTDLLKEQMGFRGLVITDALNMKGVSGYAPPGRLEVKALQAGNDILLMPENVPVAIKAIKDAMQSGELDTESIHQKVRKVLYFKEKSGLDKTRRISTSNLYSDLNAPRVHQLNRQLAEAAVTVVKNQNDILPLRRLDTLNIAALTIGSSVENPFQNMLANYAPVEMMSIAKNHTNLQAQNILEQLSDYNLVIVSVQNNSLFPGRNYGINSQTIELVNRLSRENNVILNIFANPYTLKTFGESLDNSVAIMVSYQDGRQYEEASAQIIFGAIGARGRLPVSVMPHFPIYTGITTPGRLRIRYASPEETGVNSEMLKIIDSLALKGIREKAFPGCQVAVIKDNAMIYKKSFGHHTYDEIQQVKNSDIYDLASLTKILSTTAALMRMTDEGIIELDKTLGDYLPWLKGSNKEDLAIREVLAHQSKLRSWIPFYIQTLDEGKPSAKVYSSVQSEEFPVQVAEDIYIHKTYRDTIFNAIKESDLLQRKRYIYSDLGFILFAQMVEELTGKSIDEYVSGYFYQPLGLKNITYNPLRVHEKNKIIPTENDTIFRRQNIQGYVHDPGAGMLGGVSGHAGLFSNASDVAVIMQMFLNNGSYGGTNFISPHTIKEFTATQFAGNKNRRALGFDKPNITPSDFHPSCESASVQSFGHSGFTGTYTWADPQEGLVYVFLSNRVQPDASNRKITELEIRTKIHQAIYNAIYFERFMSTNRLP